MKMNLVVIVGICGLFFCCACTSSAEDSAPKTYKIAYNVLYDAETQNYEIFAMNMDGSDRENISNFPGVEWTYYAYEDRLYFVSDKDTAYRHYFLYEMDAEGGNIRQLSNFRLRDSWFSSRKDGQEFIVTPHPSVDSSAFFIINRQGDLLKKVQSGLAYYADPAFSADGRRIVFRGAEKKSKREKGFVDELYIIDENGKNLRQLTYYPPSDSSAEWYAYKAGAPQWHPSGNFISYQSKQNGKYSLYAVTPDGSKQWKLTENPQEEGWHSWSSDGKWLAIELFDAGQTQFHIGLMNWQNKELTVLTDTSYQYQQSPVFVEVDSPSL